MPLRSTEVPEGPTTKPTVRAVSPYALKCVQVQLRDAAKTLGAVDVESLSAEQCERLATAVRIRLSGMVEWLALSEAGPLRGGETGTISRPVPSGCQQNSDSLADNDSGGDANAQ